MMSDDHRERLYDAALTAWNERPVVCEYEHRLPLGGIVDAVVAVRDEEMEAIRHASATTSRINHELRAEIIRLRANAEKDVCSGCMQREEARDRTMESARQVGVKYEAAKQSWYKAEDRAEKADADVARVRKAADEMAATPPGYGKPPTARGTWARAGRVILAALDEKDAGES